MNKGLKIPREYMREEGNVYEKTINKDGIAGADIGSNDLFSVTLLWKIS